MNLFWRKSWVGDSKPFFATAADPQAAMVAGLDALREVWQLQGYRGLKPIFLLAEVPNPIDPDDPRETEEVCVATVQGYKDFAAAAEWWDENCAGLLREATDLITTTQLRNDYTYPF